MTPRRILIILLAAIVLIGILNNSGSFHWIPGSATEETGGGTHSSEGKIPVLLISELVGGEPFEIDVLYSPEASKGIHLAYSFEPGYEEVEDLFGSGAFLGVKVRPSSQRDPGFVPTVRLGTYPTWHRSGGIVPERFAGRTLYLQAFVEDEDAEGGYALSSPISVPIRFPAERATYHVDANLGSDQNPGTPELPWETLNYAVDQLVFGDDLVVEDGVYRERVVMRQSGVPGYPIRIRNAEGASPMITGCDLITGFSPLFVEAGYEVSHEVDPVGVYVNGSALLHLGPDDALMPKSYRYRGGKVEIRLSGDTDPQDAEVEFVVRDQGLWIKEADHITVEGISISGTKEQGLWIFESEGIRLRDISVRDALTNHGMDVSSSKNCWIEECVIENCGDLITHHAGVHVGNGSERIWILGGSSSRNILLGYSLYQVKESLIFGVRAFENFEGIIAEEAPESWIVRCEAYENRNGIGTDGNRVECPGMRVMGCLSRDNEGNGFTSFENPSGALFYRNVSTRNGSPWGNGFWVYDSVGDTFLHNTSIYNGGSGISVEGLSREIMIANNILAYNDNAALAILLPSSELLDPIVGMKNTLDVEAGNREVQWSWESMTLAQFQSVTGLDKGSFVADPQLVTDEAGRFVPASGSPVIDAGVGFGGEYLGSGPDIGAVESDPTNPE